MLTLRRQLPPLTSLVAFEATARLESMTLAADELCVTREAISRQIKLLESFLELKLFDRFNRCIKLTVEGDSFYQAIGPCLNKIAINATNLRNKNIGKVYLHGENDDQKKSQRLNLGNAV